MTKKLSGSGKILIMSIFIADLPDINAAVEAIVIRHPEEITTVEGK